MTANYQSKVYECSISNAAIVLEEGTSWINTFNGGINLEKGDTMRILGSFVNESAEGDQIEITSDMAINVIHTPYIKGSTLATANTRDDLLDVGMYGDVCFGTDATGIEPPQTTLPIEELPGPAGGPALVYSIEPLTDANYQTPSTTAGVVADVGAGVISNKKSRWNEQAEESSIFGTTINTNKKLSLFMKQSVDNELYLAQQVKKLILPVMDGICNRQHNIDNGAMDTVYNVNDIRTPFEELTLNAPDTGAGRFSGAPKPGMLIATVDIAGTSGWYEPSGQAIYSNKRVGVAFPYNAVDGQGLYGLPNLMRGVQSVIAKIIAVRPYQYVIKGKATNCFEVYVTDFVNPGTKKKGFYEHTFAPNTYNAIRITGSPILPTNVELTCRSPVHGAGQKTNGYSSNPAFNPINGMYMGYGAEPFRNNYTGGSYSGYVDQINPRDTTSASAGIRHGSDDSSTAADTEYRLGLGQSYGLSYLWNGGSCSMMRGPSEGSESCNGNSFTIWNRDPASPPTSDLDISFQTYNTGFDGANPFGFADPSIPMTLGAYICVNENTMLDILNNGQDLDQEDGYGAFPIDAGLFPRIWFEWSHQNIESKYRNRHYVGNSSIIADYATPPTFASTHYENRYGYDMCGKPDNKNWINNSHDFGSNAIPTAPASGNTGCTPYSSQNTVDPDMTGTGDPIIFSSVSGFRTWATNSATTPLSSAEGTPFEWCGYNTTINSTHFQQKDTGDTHLSRGNEILEFVIASAQPTGLVIEIELGANPQPSILQVVRLGGNWGDAGVGVPTTHYISIDGVVAGGSPTTRLVTLSHQVSATNPGQKVYIGKNQGQWTDGIGTTGTPWATDLLMIKEHLTKIDVPAGYYTKEQLGARINDVLHYSTNKYKLEDGIKNSNGDYDVPTTVGVKEENFAPNPTMINGNFVHSYIPEISYGFTPVTSVNASSLDLTASTKEVTSELLTYDFDGVTFYNQDTLPDHNGTTVRYVWENDTNDISWFGKHFKVYTIPYLEQNNSVYSQTHLIRLKGGSLTSGDFDGTVTPTNPTPDYKWTINNPLGPRFSGWLEPLRGNRAEAQVHHAVNNSILGQGTAYTYCYKTRGVRNILNYGGSSRIFCGANNISVEFNDLANRFNIYNIYTPIRPHASENPADASFSIDDAVPSSIINMKKTGDIDDSLTGVYISTLNGGAFTENEWGRSWADHWLYDVLDDDVISGYGTLFLNALGYVQSQLDSIEGYGITKDVLAPYTFRNQLEFYGQTLRGGAKITPAINGSNPFANSCLNINPVQQYMIETESDDFFAKDYPTLGTNPYYFIGSDLPINHFFGTTAGGKLPVIGINARNFHSFGFSFDLGASSIEYVIDRPEVITSITTAIYNSSMRRPTNISKFSSLILLHTKNGYYKSMTPEQSAQAVKNYQQMIKPQNLQYFQPPRATTRTEPPVNIPPNFYNAQWNGSLLNPYENSDSEDDTFD